MSESRLSQNPPERYRVRFWGVRWGLFCWKKCQRAGCPRTPQNATGCVFGGLDGVILLEEMSESRLSQNPPLYTNWRCLSNRLKIADFRLIWQPCGQALLLVFNPLLMTPSLVDSKIKGVVHGRSL